MGTWNPSPRGHMDRFAKNCIGLTPHLALRPGRGSPGVTVKLGTSRRVDRSVYGAPCTELRAGHAAVQCILCVHTHLPMPDLPHARHHHSPDASQAGSASLETENHPHAIPPIPRSSAKKEAHTGVSLACSFIGRAGRPQSTAVSEAWGQSPGLLSAAGAEAARPVCVPTSPAMSPVPYCSTMKSKRVCHL